MKGHLALLVAGLALVLAAAASAAAAARAPAAVQSYTGCLSPILNAIYDVAPGDAPAHACVRPAAVIRLSSGDVTSLAAGTGLSGGGDNGDVSMSIAPSFRLPQACTNGQTASWNGTAWACASFASQADFNAFVALLSSPGTINDASNPVHWTKLKGVPAGFADGTDNVGPSYAAGTGLNLAGTTFSVDPGQVQNRIGGTCPAGSSIRAISQDGSVTCEGHAAYTAGAGLALNGSEFSVADGGVTPAKLSFDPATHADLVGLAQQLSQPGTLNGSGNPVDWTKLKHVPAGFADGTDDSGLSEISTGLGLTGAGTAGDPLQLAASYRAPQGCSSGQLAKWNGSAWACANDELANGGGGGPGAELRSFCGFARVNPRSAAPCRGRSVDRGGVGQGTSIALGTDANPVVSYVDAYSGSLKVARCNDPACARGNETLSTVDAGGGQVDQGTSVAIGADGDPVVSYFDGLLGVLKVARCNDPACSGGNETLSSVDSAGYVGQASSLAIGTDGNPVISYFDGSNRDLKVARCNDRGCTGGDETVSTVDSAGEVGLQSSLAIGTDGNPVISYFDASNGYLKVARCNDRGCTGGDETLSTVDSHGPVGGYSSLAIGMDGNPVVSYYDESGGGLKVARCNDPGCTGGNETISTVDSTQNVGAYSSLAIGTDGNPVISYYDGSNGGLKVARCNDPACAGGNETLTEVDSGGIVGTFSSLAIGTDGNPVVSYDDLSNGDLKVARVPIG